MDGAKAGAAAQVGGNNAGFTHPGIQFRQNTGKIFIGKPMEAVTLDALIEKTLRQAVIPGCFRLRMVKSGVKAGDLRYSRQQFPKSPDRGKIMRLMQGGERDKLFQVV